MHARNKPLSSFFFAGFLMGIAVGPVACSSDDGDVPFGGAGSSVDGGESASSSGGRSSNGDGGTSDGSGVGGTGAGTSATAGTTSSGGTTATTGAACDNGIDDDGDGLVDGLDPECTGPFDNDEGSFATGIPGDNRDPKWQDCFFDGNSGAGDDGCRYHTDCLYGLREPDDPSCALAEACVEYCRPLTPNGCDCFGCCTIQREDGTTVDVFEAATCSLATLDDTDACPRCTKSTACANDCGECELCPGKTELPEHCGSNPGTGGAGGASGVGGSPGSGGAASDPPPPSHTCDGGEQVCGPGLPECEDANAYCSLGCCIGVVVR